MESGATEAGTRPGRARRGRVSAAAVLESAAQGFLVFDSRLRVALCNPQAAVLLGLGSDEVVDGDGRVPLARLLHASRTLPEAAQAELAATARDARAGALVVARRIGWLSVTVQPLARRKSDGGGHGWLLSLDAAEAGSDAPRLDALTGLLDRGWFLHQFGRLLPEVPEAEGMATVVLDFDRFRAVNEVFGSVTGDGLLRAAATRLRSALRGSDLLGRVGGDQFAVAVHGFPRPEGLAARLIELLSRPYLIDGQIVTVTASAGVCPALPPEDMERRADTLLHAAGLALRQAKAEGRRSVCTFQPEMQARAEARSRLEADLRAALALEQFELHYQPQVELSTGVLIGFEALLRWRHPRRGLVAPDAFIPTLEALGLIVPVGEWALWTACRAAAAWSAPLTVAVNVSAMQLLDRERLPRAVSAALAETGLPPHRLELEITESALARHADIALQALQDVRAMGVGVAMDDFGVGYSSLSQLRRFPFNRIKIDRSFVRDVGDHAEAVAVVRAIAALGSSLGLSTTAEGVETAEQQRLVLAEGCTNMQGFLVSRPVPGWEVQGLIRRFRASG